MARRGPTRRGCAVQSGAPTLFASTSQSEISVALDHIASHGKTLNELLADLRRAGVDSASLVALQVDIARLGENLDELKLLVNNQLLVREQKYDLLRRANQQVGTLQGLLVPFLSVIDEQIGQWRRLANDVSLTPEREVPAFVLGPMRRGLAESVEISLSAAAGA